MISHWGADSKPDEVEARWKRLKFMERIHNMVTKRTTSFAALILGLTFLCGAAGGAGLDFDAVGVTATSMARAALRWYERTPPADRVTWGGLTAAAVLALSVSLERLARLRRRSILPEEFQTRFLARLLAGKLDRGKALDFCELKPSPASRVALAAVKRWGRPVADLERTVSLAHRLEAGRLRKNIGTLRRLAALAPLLGLLGTLHAASRSLTAIEGATLGPALAVALGPITAGVAFAVVALVVYDGLTLRAESLVADLETVGAQTIDAITMAMPQGPVRTPHQMRQDPTRSEPSRPIQGSGEFA